MQRNYYAKLDDHHLSCDANLTSEDLLAKERATIEDNRRIEQSLKSTYYTHFAPRKAGPWHAVNAVRICGAPQRNQNASKPRVLESSDFDIDEASSSSMDSDCKPQQPFCKASSVQRCNQAADMFEENIGEEQKALRDVLRKNALSFDKDLYKEHHGVIERSSADSTQVVVSMAEEIGFTNLAMWKSFAVFVLLMLSMQPKSLLPNAGRRICVEAVTAADDVLRQVCRASLFIGGNPIMDGALRKRPVFAADMFARLFQRQDAALT
jgi:hypothetical protein